ncbi:hypothetical protein MRX96_013927 [Rhipicephalus microplus]
MGAFSPCVFSFRKEPSPPANTTEPPPPPEPPHHARRSLHPRGRSRKATQKLAGEEEEERGEKLWQRRQEGGV